MTLSFVKLVSCCLALLSTKIKGSKLVDEFMAGKMPLGVQNVGTIVRPVSSNGYAVNIPGNGPGIFGTMTPIIPGVQLPGEASQPARPSGKQLFNPFSQVVDSTFYKAGTQAFGNGQAIHGVNPLNIPVKQLYPYMRNQDLPKFSPAVQQLLPQDPFTTVVVQGAEMERVDMGIAGKLNFPEYRPDGTGRRFDVNGFFNVAFNVPVNNILGELNVPYKDTNSIWTLKGKLVAASPNNFETPYQFAEMSQPANPLDIPLNSVLPSLFQPSNPARPVNPAFVGK